MSQLSQQLSSGVVGGSTAQNLFNNVNLFNAPGVGVGAPGMGYGSGGGSGIAPPIPPPPMSQQQQSQFGLNSIIQQQQQSQQQRQTPSTSSSLSSSFMFHQAGSQSTEDFSLINSAGLNQFDASLAAAASNNPTNYIQQQVSF